MKYYQKLIQAIIAEFFPELGFAYDNDNCRIINLHKDNLYN